MFSTLSAARRVRRVPRLCFRPKLETLEDRLAPAGYSLTDLGTPSGFSEVVPYALSNNGQVVALAFTSGSLKEDLVVFGDGKWTDLGPITGFTTFVPIAINDSRQILVDASGTVNHVHVTLTLLYSNGKWINLNPPSEYQLYYDGVGLDEAGQVLVDAALTTPQGLRGVDTSLLYDNGQWINLGKLASGFDPLPLAINGTGQVLATAAMQNGADHEYLYGNGQWTDLGTPNGGDAILSGDINDNGQVLVLASAGHPSLYSNGQWTDIGTPSGYNTPTFDGLDDAGQALINGLGAGSGGILSPPSHPFLYSNGQWNDLNNLLPAGSTVTLSEAIGLNNKGQMLAVGSDQHVYLLTPQQPITSPPPSPSPSPSPSPAGPADSSAPTPVPFLQAVITLYIDGIEKILHDSPAIEQSIQDNLSWAVFGGFDIGNFVVLLGEMAVLGTQHGGGNGA